MTSLFSVFDPLSYFGISLNWVILSVVLMIWVLGFYLVKSGWVGMVNKVMSIFSDMFKEVGSTGYLAMVMISVMTLMYLMMSNLMGLFPFVFTSTAHPKITLGLGLVFWMSFFLMGWMKNFKMSAAHLVPEGSPMMLAPFMVLIESVSHIIRPFTLSIRLAANMMAGHLIIGLLASISEISVGGFLGSLALQSMLLILEFAVGVIQGFVFSILLMLYALEYY